MNHICTIRAGASATGPFTSALFGNFVGYQSISAPSGECGTTDIANPLDVVITSVGNYPNADEIFPFVSYTVLTAPVGTSPTFFDVMAVVAPDGSYTLYNRLEAKFYLANADGSQGGNIPFWYWPIGNNEGSTDSNFSTGSTSVVTFYPSGFASEITTTPKPITPAPFTGSQYFLGYTSANAPVPNVGSLVPSVLAGVSIEAMGFNGVDQFLESGTTILVAPPGTAEDFFIAMRLNNNVINGSGNTFLRVNTQFPQFSASYELRDSTGAPGGNIPTWTWQGEAYDAVLFTAGQAAITTTVSNSGGGGGGGGVGTTQKFSYYVRAFFTKERYVRSNVVFPPYPGESA